MRIARRVSQSHCGVSHNLGEHCMEDTRAVWRLEGDHSLGNTFLGSHKLGRFARTCSSEDAYRPTNIVDYFYLPPCLGKCKAAPAMVAGGGWRQKEEAVTAQ